jgi:hypothetical protein
VTVDGVLMRRKAKRLDYGRESLPQTLLTTVAIVKPFFIGKLSIGGINGIH